MWWRLVLVGALAAGVPAFSPTPIFWGGLPAKTFALTPSSWPIIASVVNKGSVQPQMLTIRELPSSISPNEIPRFTARSDESISWDGVEGWCVEASGDAVGVNHCNGGPAQLWTRVPWGPGLSLIQLKDTSKCIEANLNDMGREGHLTGAPVLLRECAHKMSEAWAWSEPVLFPRHTTSSLIQHMIISSMAALGALILGVWRWRWQTNARVLSLSPGASCRGMDQGGVALCAPLAGCQRHAFVSDFLSDAQGYAPWKIGNFGSLQVPLNQASHSSTERLAPSVIAMMGPSLEVLERSSSVSVGLPTQAGVPTSAVARQGGGGGNNGKRGGGGGGGGSGGGGGGNGNNGNLLRTLSRAELTIVLDEWMQQSQIYRMTGSFGGSEELGVAHNKQCQKLELLREYSALPRLVFCLFKNAPQLVLQPVTNSEDVTTIWALVGVEASEYGFATNVLAIKPSSLNSDKDRTPVVRTMLNAIVDFSRDMGVEIDLEPLVDDQSKETENSDDDKNLKFNSHKGEAVEDCDGTNDTANAPSHQLNSTPAVPPEFDRFRADSET